MEITLPAIGESSRTQCNFYSPLCEVGTIYDFSFKISGLTGNSTVFVKPGTNGGGAIIAQYNKDGVYHLNYTLTDEAIIDESTQNRIYFFIQNFSNEEMNLTVEQIPDHDGYLVTDGVDDGVSSLSVIENIKDFTWVGEFIFPQYTGSINYTGIQKPNDFILYNYYNSANKAINVFINGTTNNRLINRDIVKAVCSEGLVYDEKWNSIVIPVSTNINTARVFSVGYNPLNNRYGKMLFKNIGRIPRKLSKEDSIKAYIYLQTLKAK